MTAAFDSQRLRVPILDEVRGFDILAMILYHLAYDLVKLGVWDLPFFFSGWMNLIRDIFAGAFIVISGICCLYSRNNLKRGVSCLLAAVFVEGATALVPGMSIRFGILHLLGWSMTLTGLLEDFLGKTPEKRGLFAASACFLAGYLLTPWMRALSLNGDGLYRLGFPGEGFSSSDYFPLIPWLFLFWAGYFGGRLLRRQGLLRSGKPVFPFLSLCGRHSLWIYLLHQPVLAVFLLLIQK